MKDGKLVVEFPINVWPGWAPIIVANGGLDPNDQSVFAKKYGFYVKLSIVDDPVKARDLFAAGQSHILWGTLDMIALFAPELVKDSRTVPVVCQQSIGRAVATESSRAASCGASMISACRAANARRSSSRKTRRVTT